MSKKPECLIILLASFIKIELYVNFTSLTERKESLKREFAKTNKKEVQQTLKNLQKTHALFYRIKVVITCHLRKASELRRH